MGKELKITDDLLMSRILEIRGQKVMIDRDIAELYGVPTKRLNEQVKRNGKRFPTDFMFQLTAEEKTKVVANCDHLKNHLNAIQLVLSLSRLFAGIFFMKLHSLCRITCIHTRFCNVFCNNGTCANDHLVTDGYG